MLNPGYNAVDSPSVIPAQAGIQVYRIRFGMNLDTHFRGYDRPWVE